MGYDGKQQEAAARMADAIQRFHNLRILGQHHRLRATPEYGELCDAWKNYIDEGFHVPLESGKGGKLR